MYPSRWLILWLILSTKECRKEGMYYVERDIRRVEGYEDFGHPSEIWFLNLAIITLKHYDASQPPFRETTSR